MTFTSVTVGYAKFYITGNLCQVIVEAGGTTGGTATQNITFTLPVPIAVTVNRNPSGYAIYADGGPTSMGLCIYEGNDMTKTTINVRNATSSNWGLGSGREFAVTIFMRFNPKFLFNFCFGSPSSFVS